MLRLASMWFGLAIVAVLFAFTGVIQQKVFLLVSHGVFYVAAGFVVLSLLLSLFEEGNPSRQRGRHSGIPFRDSGEVHYGRQE